MELWGLIQLGEIRRFPVSDSYYVLSESPLYCLRTLLVVVVVVVNNTQQYLMRRPRAPGPKRPQWREWFTSTSGEARMKYPWQDSGHAVKFVANYARTPPATPRGQAAKCHRNSPYGSAATAAPPSAATLKTRRARSV